jgi:hypothetical protein
MAPELATVVERKVVAKGLMMGRTRLKAEWRALGHMGFEGWRRSVVGMHVD